MGPLNEVVFLNRISLEVSRCSTVLALVYVFYYVSFVIFVMYMGGFSCDINISFMFTTIFSIAQFSIFSHFYDGNLFNVIVICLFPYFQLIVILMCYCQCLTRGSIFLWLVLFLPRFLSFVRSISSWIYCRHVINRSYPFLNPFTFSYNGKYRLRI